MAPLMPTRSPSLVPTRFFPVSLFDVMASCALPRIFRQQIAKLGFPGLRRPKGGLSPLAGRFQPQRSWPLLPRRAPGDAAIP